MCQCWLKYPPEVIRRFHFGCALRFSRITREQRDFMARGLVTICVWLLMLAPAFAASPKAAAAKPIDFNREIRPILSDNCFACHGPDENKRKAKLRFDIKED